MSTATNCNQVQLTSDELALDAFVRSLGDTELLLVGGGDVSFTGN